MTLVSTQNLLTHKNSCAITQNLKLLMLIVHHISCPLTIKTEKIHHHQTIEVKKHNIVIKTTILKIKICNKMGENVLQFLETSLHQ
jgi:hypothetical protein